MSTEMPGRPSQGDVETASLRAFESRLPDNWEANERRRDYGIDLDIEIFSDERATGLGFGVQVKGTSDLGSRPTAQIKWTTWNYWSAQSDPVLVVLWDMDSQQLWWEWSHRFDTSQLDSNAHRSFTFAFPESQVWDPETPELVQREIEAWRAWSSPYAHLPIGLEVQGTGSVAGVPATRIAAALRAQVREQHDLFELESETAPLRVLRLAVDIESERSVIWISGGPSATLHYESLEPVDPETSTEAEQFVRMMVADIMLLISRQFGLINALGPAARIAGAALDDSSVVYHPEVAAGLLQLLLEENRIDDGVRLLGRLLLASDSVPGVLALLSINSIPNPQPEHILRIATALRDMAWFQARTGGSGAELAYNGAQLLTSLDASAAIDLFDEASRLDPAYRERGYWWSERGGCLFLSSRYEEAATHYRKSLNMGVSEALPLLADSLMFAGRYREALEILRQVVDDADLSRPEWRLKYCVLEGLINETGIEQQERDSSSALEALGESPNPGSIESALELDLLCPDALRSLGVDAEENDERSVDFFLAEALADPLHAHAWIRAMRSAGLEESNLLGDIGSCARRFCGTTILGVLETEEAPRELVEFVESLFSDAPADLPRPVEFRMVAQGSPEYVSVHLEEDPHHHRNNDQE